MSARTVLLLGATGLVGGHCLDLLLNDDDCRRIVSLSRRVLPLNHAKLEQHAIDFERLPDFKHLMQAQDVYCCLGTTIKRAGSQAAFRKVDYGYPVEVAALAAGNGAAQFLLVSSLGANRASRVFYSRIKGETEAAIAALPFKGVQIVRPSLLLGERAEFRLGERLAEKAARLGSFLLVGPLGKYRPIHARAVAAAMLKIAKAHPAGVNFYESDQLRRIAGEVSADKRADEKR